jgi:hypothetical protein
MIIGSGDIESLSDLGNSAGERGGKVPETAEHLSGMTQVVLMVPPVVGQFG